MERDTLRDEQLSPPRYVVLPRLFEEAKRRKLTYCGITPGEIDDRVRVQALRSEIESKVGRLDPHLHRIPIRVRSQKAVTRKSLAVKVFHQAKAEQR
jgi:hypothetical protein